MYESARRRSRRSPPVRSPAAGLPDLDGVDLVLLGGDLTNFRGVEVARVIVDEIRARRRGARRLRQHRSNLIEDYLRAEEIDLDRRARVVGRSQLRRRIGGSPLRRNALRAHRGAVRRRRRGGAAGPRRPRSWSVTSHRATPAAIAPAADTSDRPRSVRPSCAIDPISSSADTSTSRRAATFSAPAGSSTPAPGFREDPALHRGRRAHRARVADACPVRRGGLGRDRGVSAARR